MDSNYGGEQNLGSERSSRKLGKKKNSDKPAKQPQRGLGVAQLEKIRLHSQNIVSDYSSPLLTPNYPNTNPIQMGIGNLERANIRHGDSQPNADIARYNAGNYTTQDAQHYHQLSVTRHLINLQTEELTEKKKKNGRSSETGSGSQNSECSGSQDLDLELRLSI